MAEKSSKLGRKDLESWLREVLIPIEPNPTFIRELRGNLIQVTGSGSISPWMIILVIAMTILFITSWLGVALRIVLAVIAFFGIIRPRLNNISNKSLTST